MKNCLIVASILMAGSKLACAQGSYVPPQQTRLMFHIDKLPIDKDRCNFISEQLTILVKREHDGSVRQHRLSAKTLMLAMRLNSGNLDAQRVNKELVSGVKPPASDQVENAKAALRIQQVIKGLMSTEVDSEGQVLATYLKDVMVGYVPDNPLYEGYKLDDDRWQGILPEPPKAEVAIKPLEPGLPHGEGPQDEKNLATEPGVENPETTDTPEIKEIGDSITHWNKHTSSLTQPLLITYKEGEYDKERTELVPLSVTVKPEKSANSNLSLEIDPPMEDYKLEEFKNVLSTMMRNHFKKYDDVHLKIYTEPKLHSNSRKDLALPICLQLMASANDVTIRKGTIVIGTLQGKNIKRGYGFWKKFKYVLPESTKPGRLIVATEAELEVSQLIALEKEAFFLKHEVLTAANVQEATDMLGDSAVTEIKEASDDFAKIQKLIGTKSIGPFSVDKKMRQRLEAILVKNPNHLSAKMILLRGDPARNKRLERFFIAREASASLSRVSWMSGKDSLGANVDSMEAGMEAIDEFNKKYRRLIDTEDRDLGRYLSEIYETLEDLVRMKKKNESKTNTKAINGEMIEFTSKFKKAKVAFDKAAKASLKSNK